MRLRLGIGLTLVLACLVALGVMGCSSGAEDGVSQQLVQVERGDLVLSVTGSGKIEAASDSRLTFGSTGKVARIYVEEGDAVSKGDTLAELDTSTLELSVTQAQMALAQAQAGLAQAKVAQRTAERNLENTRDSEDALKLALLNAQITQEQVQRTLDTAITSTDYDAIRAELNKAEAWYQYILDSIEAGTGNLDDLTLELDLAKDRLNTAQTRYDNLLAGYDSQEITIKKDQLQAAKMAVAQAEKNLGDLSESIALQEMQAASATQSMTQAEQAVAFYQESLAEAQRQLEDATIVAPFDGIVAQVLVKEGDVMPSPSMAPKTAIYLIDPSRMKLLVDLDEMDIPVVKVDQKAAITLDALPGEELEGWVTKVLPVPTETAGVVLFSVRVDFDVPDGSKVRIGMSASADIIAERHDNVLTVPSRAVTEDASGNTIVTVVTNDQNEDRQVEVGLDDGSRTEIISGLNEGETVLVEVRVRSTSGMSMF